jgi:AcrR family transcriptional regulator
MSKSPRKRLQDREVRRAQILDEAITMIGERGYNGFAVQDLAQRCGLTNGGLLYHFGSKEQLLLAVLNERDRRLAGEVVAVHGQNLRSADRKGAPLSVVLEVLRSIVGRASATPELTRLYGVLQAEALSPLHPAHDYFVAREAGALEWFETLVGPHVANPPAVARQLHALMDGLALQWLRGGRTFDLIATWDQAVTGIAWCEGCGQEEATT